MNNKIREICEYKKISISNLARKANISRVHLYDIMNKKAEPTGPVMFKIANALGESITTIFFDDSGNHEKQFVTSDTSEERKSA